MHQADRARQYRDRAEELRTIAQDFIDAESQKMLVRLALNYEAMAESVERMAFGKSKL